MATRLYCRNTVATASPTAGKKSARTMATQTGSPVEDRKLDTVKGSTANVASSATSQAVTSNQNVYLGRWSSDALAAQTIAANTWTLGFIGVEANAAANAFHSVSIYVWRPSNSSVVGYIYDTDTPLGTEILAGVLGDQRGQVLTVSGGAVTCQAGDILVVEAWTDQTQSMGSAYLISFYYDGANDVTAGTTTTGAYVETPQDFTFAGAGVTENLGLLSAATSLLTATVAPGAVSQSLALQTVTASLHTATDSTVIPAQTENLALQTVTASLRNTTVTPGAVSQSLALQTVAASLRTATESSPAPGSGQTLGLLALAASLENTAVTPGAVSQNLALQSITASLRNITVVPGTATESLALQSVDATLHNASIAIAGAFAKVIQLVLEPPTWGNTTLTFGQLQYRSFAELTAEGTKLTAAQPNVTVTAATPGATQNLALQTVTASLRNITVVPGNKTTTLALQTLAGSLLTPSVLTAGVTNLALQTLTASLRNTTVIPGGVVMGLRVDPPSLEDDVTTLAQMAHRTVDELMSDDMSVAASLRNATTSSVSSGVTNLALLTLSGTLRNTTTIPGAVVLGLRVAPPSLDDDVTTLAQMAHRTVDELMSDNMTLVSALRTVTDSTTDASPVTINLALQTLTAALRNTTVIPGGVSQALALQALAAALRNITATSGVTVNLALQTLTAALRNITATGGATTVPLGVLQGTGLLLTANVSISGDTWPTAVVTLEVVPTASTSLEVVPRATVTLETVPTVVTWLETVPGAATNLEVVPTALVTVEP